MENKKIAVLYYSVSGQTRFTALKIRDMLDCDIFEIQTEEFIKPNFFSRYYRGIKQMKSKELPKLKKTEFNADMYDCIIVGSPTWASSCTPAIKAFAKENKIENKKLGFFTTYEGSGYTKCLESMKELFPNNDFIALASFKSPRRENKEKFREKLKTFAQQIKGK